MSVHDIAIRTRCQQAVRSKLGFQPGSLSLRSDDGPKLVVGQIKPPPSFLHIDVSRSVIDFVAAKSRAPLSKIDKFLVILPQKFDELCTRWRLSWTVCRSQAITMTSQKGPQHRFSLPTQQTVL